MNDESVMVRDQVIKEDHKKPNNSNNKNNHNVQNITVIEYNAATKK
jgi:hypothetical protein